MSTMTMMEASEDLTEVAEGHSVPLRRSIKKPVPGKPDTVRSLAFLRQHLADGEMNDASFTICIGFNGWLEIVFNNDYDKGQYLINPKDFVEVAYEAYKVDADIAEEE